VLLVDRVTPGEYEDMDVGVEDILKGPGDSESRVDGVEDRAYCGVGSGRISVGPASYSPYPEPSISNSGSERTRMEEEVGKEMPSTVSENGSLNSPGSTFTGCSPS
jgi:hypothetical protein